VASNVKRLAASRQLTEHEMTRLVDLHGGEILRTTRRLSACAADAEDAYQNTLEKLMTRPPAIDADDLAGWLTVVARNEALMIRRRHKHVDTGAFDELAAQWEADTDLPDERIVDNEVLGQRREALRKLTPDQLRCLLLKADGMSYREISQLTGITYASVNRYLTEGRRACRTMLGRIESGEECRRLEPSLSAVADGIADARTMQAVEVHLDHCMLCRATLADFRATPSKLAALLPVASDGTLTDDANWLRQAGEQLQAAVGTVPDRLAGLTSSFQPGGEMALAKKAAVATAIAASLAAGSVGVKEAIDRVSNGPLTGELIEVTHALPTTGSAGPTSATEGATETQLGAEEAARTATNPEDADVLRASQTGDSGDDSLPGDADPADDPFADQPQFTQPDAGTGTGIQGGDPYGGLAP
jgi:RNA polymerase sigma-70 factor (ECF subfamily)